MHFIPLFQTISFLGNSLFDYSISFLTFVIAIISFKFFQLLLIHRLKKLASKTHTQIDDTLIDIVQSIKPRFYYLAALYIALQLLNIHRFITQSTYTLLIVFGVFQLIEISSIFIEYFTQNILSKKADSDTQSAITALKIVSKILIWTFGALLLLSNLGFDVTSLIAGLGIGGVAVALAVQNILGDLLSSFSIYFDKPFQAGDFIIVNPDTMGVVQKIGIKTTRIQALQGEEIVVPNQMLTNTTIQNFKKLRKRRVVFNLGITYETNQNKLTKAPQIIADIINNIDNAEFDRAHFNQFGDSALNLEIVYYATTSDYNQYMDIQQQINLDIFSQFAKHQIDFAYPTQTVFLHKS